MIFHSGRGSNINVLRFACRSWLRRVVGRGRCRRLTSEVAGIAGRRSSLICLLDYALLSFFLPR